MLALLKDLQQQDGIAYLFVSHDLSVVRQIAHRVAVMDHGRIVERGTHRELLQREGVYAGMWALQQQEERERELDEEAASAKLGLAL